MAKVTRILDEYGRPTTGASVQFIKRVERVHLTDNKADYTLMLRSKRPPGHLFAADGFVVHSRKRSKPEWLISKEISQEFKIAHAEWESLLPWEKLIWKIYLNDLWEEPYGMSPSSFFIKYNVARLKNGESIAKYPYPGAPRIPQVPQVEMLFASGGQISIYMEPYFDYDAFAFFITIRKAIRYDQMKQGSKRKGETETLFWPSYHCFGIPKGIYAIKIEAFSPTGGVAGCAKHDINPYADDIDTTPWAEYTSF